MGDPRRNAPSSDELAGEPGKPSSRWTGADDGPAHPWEAIIQRFAADPAPLTGSDSWRVVVIWWQTRAGRQPVLLVRRIRRD